MGINTEKGFKEYRYFHCKHLLPFTPALTFKFDVDQKKSLMVFSWAACSDNDNFDRKVGKKLVDERIKANDSFSLSGVYNRDLPLIENAINGMRKYHNSYKDFVDNNVENKNLITEIKRALDIYGEVSMWLGREAILDRIVCDSGC